MVDAVNTVGTGSTVAAVAASQSTASATTAISAAAKATAPAATATQNYDYFAPRQFSDPSTGIFITEQLDSKGNITYQDPEGITLVYLRNGLTATGLPKQTVTA